MGDRLFANLASGATSLGVGLTMPSVEILDAYDTAGWDVCYATMHSTRIDWHDIDAMARSAKSLDITVCARIPMQPWVGDDNPLLPVDAHRAFSIGVPAVMASVRSTSEASSLVEIMLVEERRLGRRLLSIPCIETLSAWEQIDEILALSGMRCIFLGVSDVAQALGATDPDDRELSSMVRTFIARAHQWGVYAAVNVGYPDNAATSWQGSVDRARWLEEIGADVVFGVPAQQFLTVAARAFASEFRARAAAGLQPGPRQ